MEYYPKGFKESMEQLETLRHMHRNNPDKLRGYYPNKDILLSKYHYMEKAVNSKKKRGIECDIQEAQLDYLGEVLDKLGYRKEVK